MFGYYCGNINASNSTPSLSNNASFSNAHTVADERSQILEWLSPLEPRMRHQAVRTNRLSGVGDWLLQTDTFRDWSDVARQDRFDNATLFCYGHPGVGKTYVT